nr:MOSC N-terminal beta barrel domain-containing protein [Cohnella zeiphila]
MIGRVTRLVRYPVKSMAGESLEQTAVEPYGLYGDRSHAFVDETKEGWDRYVTARRIPSLLRYRASLLPSGSGEEFPEVRIEAPDGRLLAWDEELRRDVQSLAGTRPLSMIRWRQDEQGLLAVDSAAILIVTDRGLRRLAELLGRDRIDPRRFRANVLLAIEEGGPDDDTALLGKRLHIGEHVVLDVREACERCSMITLDPDSGDRDVSILRTVNEKLGLIFGVYASVIDCGSVRVGDSVFIGE